MHLDVCLDIVDMCKQVQIWILPVMQFYFQHVTCSCIFHAYVLFLSFCSVLMCFLSFSHSLSLGKTRAISICELSAIRLDSFSIHRETFYLADRFSTASRCIEVLLPSTDPRQHRDRFTSVGIQCSIDLDRSSIHQAIFFFICLRGDWFFIFSLLSGQKTFPLDTKTLSHS